MKRLSPVALVVAALLAAPPAPAATPRDRCALRGSSTVASNPVARVYERRGVLFGCVRRSGARRALARSFDDGYVSSGRWSDVVLNGTYVAWVFRRIDISCKADCPPGYDGESDWIEAVELRTRSRRSVFHGGTTVALGLSATGGLAYLLEGRELWVADGGGRRLLDSGGLGEMTVTGSTVSWRSGAGPATKVARVDGGTTCQPRAGTTRAWNDVVRAYDRGPNAALHGCAWSRSRPILLTEAPHGHVEAAGRFVAWSEADAVVVHDVLRGRQVRPPAGGAVSDVALGGDGAVAWLAGDRLFATRGTVPHEIAGGAIEPGSLAIRAGVVHWRQDGAERTAAVPR